MEDDLQYLKKISFGVLIGLKLVIGLVGLEWTRLHRSKIC